MCTVLVHPIFRDGFRVPTGDLVMLLLRGVGRKT